MTGVLRIILAISVGLAVVAASVFAMSDRYLLTAPPERELDGLLIMIANKRYTQVRPLLATDLEGTPIDSLRAIHDGIERQIGEIENVETEREWMSGDRASATASMEGMDHRTIHFRVPLIRQQGTWRVSDLRPLSDAAR